MPVFRAFPCFFALLSFVVLAGFLAPGQRTASASTEFRAARKLYYTPVDQGLQGFQCDASFNWKQFVEQANNTPVSTLDQRLLYLQSIKLSVSDDLNSSGALEWTAPTPPPDGSEQSVAQIRTGLQTVIKAFFQSWNGFYTGEMVSVTDNNTSVEHGANGYVLSARQGGKLAEELFSNDFTMLSLHVVTPDVDSTLTPVFQQTPGGRLVTGLNSTVKQPPAAQRTNIDIAVHYAAVNGFQLPSELRIDVAGTAHFDFELSGCTVRTRLTSTGTGLRKP